MKNFNLLLIALFTSITVTHAQNSGSFQVNGFLDPHYICDVSAQDQHLDFKNINANDISKLGARSHSVNGHISFMNCDLALPGGGTVSGIDLRVIPGTPSPNDQYWSILNKPNADYLGIDLRINNQKILPSSGKIIPITLYDNGGYASAEVFISAQLINVAEGEIGYSNFRVPIDFEVSYR